MTSDFETLSDWNAYGFFRDLTARCRLAAANNFNFFSVSGLDGFEQALANFQSTKAFVAVSEIADGYIELNNTPRSRRVKSVFLAMRHPQSDMAARARAMDILREIFRQFMSVLILERTRLEQQCIYIDPRISFNEINRYFFNGAACAFFQIAVDRFTDLRFNSDEWLKQ